MSNPAIVDYYELLVRALAEPESITDEEKLFMQQRARKYEIVRLLCLEKFQADAKEGEPVMTDFHFTPGESFMETAIVDIVNSIVNLDTSKATPLNFGDLTI